MKKLFTKFLAFCLLAPAAAFADTTQDPFGIAVAELYGWATGKAGVVMGVIIMMVSGWYLFHMKDKSAVGYGIVAVIFIVGALPILSMITGFSQGLSQLHVDANQTLIP